ncbi:hypothetical protein ACFXB3_35295 [Streptomyces sp. NPDC059447]|uniref:hypothetical protein n=1 Tax=Streptomyces sp. NPDC059447 TaxID=3346834 RepID=UPI0036C69797
MSLNLTKTSRTYFLVADDECANVPGAHRPDFRRFRHILLAEAAPTDAEEYSAREDWIHEGLRESQSPLQFLTYQAVSIKHAIRLARLDYEADRAREDSETEPAETTTLDARGVPHLMYGPCGATFRRVPVINQRTGRNRPGRPSPTSLCRGAPPWTSTPSTPAPSCARSPPTPRPSPSTRAPPTRSARRC